MSLHDDQDKDALSELKKTVSNEYEKRKSIPGLPETVPEQAAVSAVPTPNPEANEGKRLGEPSRGRKLMPIPTEEKQSEHPEMKTSAVEDESASLLPADVKDKDAISGGKALPTKGRQEAEVSRSGMLTKLKDLFPSLTSRAALVRQMVRPKMRSSLERIQSRSLRVHGPLKFLHERIPQRPRI